MNGLLPIPELVERFNIRMDTDRYNTVGGVVFGLLGTVPEVGFTARLDGYVATVEEMDGLRIAKLRLKRSPE